MFVSDSSGGQAGDEFANVITKDFLFKNGAELGRSKFHKNHPFPNVSPTAKKVSFLFDHCPSIPSQVASPLSSVHLLMLVIAGSAGC